MKTQPSLQVVAWETTKRCAMNCKHCRAQATDAEYANELSTSEAKSMLTSIASFSKPVLILTGGEPMVREDIYDLAAFADEKGMRVVMAPCGFMVNPDTVTKMKHSGVKAISISLDGATPASHDSFRGVDGAFEAAIQAVQCASQGGLPFQINTTVSRRNVGELEQIHALATELGAMTLDFFFLVPTGRGANLRDEEIDSTTYEETLSWIYALSQTSTIGIKTTCAPHYSRVQLQQGGGHDVPARFKARGCMGGKGFIFISHQGVVQPCGFLDLACGNLRETDYDLRSIYEGSDIFKRLRNTGIYKGTCGSCPYVNECGGCRARAYEADGDYLGPEPNCNYDQ
ncbi:MAG: radical SAM protein [Planctomycetota bacterium]|jgi:radical SAM protein with 4Fe4S-binding SPASM domain